MARFQSRERRPLSLYLRSVILLVVGIMVHSIFDGGINVAIVAGFTSAPNQHQNTAMKFSVGWRSSHCLKQSRFCAGHTLLSATREDTKTRSSSAAQTVTDVDARVLQSMLEDGALGLESEEDVQKLIKRAEKKSVAERGSAGEEKIEDNEDADQGGKKKFSSQFMQSLVDETEEDSIWNSLSRAASDVLESVSIFVANRVQTDALKAVALGLFAWDRAVRDVSRALPAAASQTKQIFLLATNSSYEESTEVSRPVDSASLMEEMNTPMDELKNVGASIRDILIDDATPSSGSLGGNQRSLRTTAISRGKDSIQRAALRAEQKRQAAPSITTLPNMMAGSVVDTTYELKRELEIESNRPGYKPRQALQAASRESSGLLEGVKQKWQLERSKRKQRLLDGSEQPLETQYLDAVLDSTEFDSADAKPAEQRAPVDRSWEPGMSETPFFSSSNSVSAPNSNTPTNDLIEEETYWESSVTVEPEVVVDDTDQTRSSSTQQKILSRHEATNVDVVSTFTSTEFKPAQQHYNDQYSSEGIATEIVSDEMFESAVGQTTFRSADAANEEEEKDDPLPLRLLYRSLDVGFFIAEKTVMVAIPQVIASSKVASVRVSEVSREGMGVKGWTLMQNANTGEKRY